MRIFYRLALLVLAAVSFPVMVQLYTAHMWRVEREEDIVANAALQAQSINADMLQIVTAHKELLRAVAETPLARRGDTALCQAYLADVGELFQSTRSIALLDRDGFITCRSAGPIAQPVPNADRLHFQRARDTGQFAVGEFTIGRLTGQRAIHLSHPVFGYDGKFAGVVSAPLNVDGLARQLQQRRLPQGSTVTVMDENGIILVDLPEGKRVGAKAPADLLFALKDAPETRRMAGPFDDQSRIVSWTNLGSEPKGFAIVVGLSEKIALAGVDRARREAWLWTAIGFVVAVAIAWLVAASMFYRPLTRISGAAQRWRDGDYSARIGLSGRSDLHRLAATFDELARQLQQRDRERGRYLAAVSHDLRQPLQSMGLAAAMLSRRQLPDADAAAVARLSRGVKDLGEMLNTLMDVAQLEAGAVRPRLEPFALAELASPIEDGFGPLAREKKLQLSVALPPVVVLSDRVLLLRMLNNIVANAIKFSPAGGSVRVSASVADERCRISVEDTGIGIAREDQERIFEDFTQLDNPQRDRSRGRGLGLGVVRRMSKALTHPIELRSAAGQGATFTIDVPAGSLQHQARAGGTWTDRLDGTVYIVEDDRDVAEAMRSMLAELHARVVVSGSVAQAIQALEGAAEEPTALIVDYRLPDGTGAGVVRDARSRWPGVSAVILTGEPLASVAIDGVSDVKVLQKPVDLQAILKALEHQETLNA